MSKTDRQNLTECYGSAHFLVEILDNMFDEKGQPKPDITKQQIAELKKLARKASCRANATGATWDGNPKIPK